ncbi:MAG: hypothetical protein EON59_11815 [Alphaproteobacteria bacterium]|nr:MAG: hypothetical protein EON59_11815 [Alphaproteobacteria bacterium]
MIWRGMQSTIITGHLRLVINKKGDFEMKENKLNLAFGASALVILGYWTLTRSNVSNSIEPDAKPEMVSEKKNLPPHLQKKVEPDGKAPAPLSSKPPSTKWNGHAETIQSAIACVLSWVNIVQVPAPSHANPRPFSCPRSRLG